MITTMIDEIRSLNINREHWKALISLALWPLLKNENPNVTILVPDAHKRTLNVRVSEASDDKTIVKFSLSFMPGCKGVLIMHRMEVVEKYRRFGISRALWPVKLRIAQDLQVSLLMCTVTADNKAENYILQNTTGFHWNLGFTNKRTKNKVWLYTYKMPEAQTP